MIFNDGLKLKGILTIKDALTGEILFTKQNTIVNTGKNLVANILNQDADYLRKICIGNDNTEVLVTDTDLGSEIFTQDFDSTSVTGNTFTCQITVATGDANANWKEVGIKSDAGVLFNRIIVDYTKTSAKAVLVIFEITVG